MWVMSCGLWILKARYEKNGYAVLNDTIDYRLYC